MGDEITRKVLRERKLDQNILHKKCFNNIYESITYRLQTRTKLISIHVYVFKYSMKSEERLGKGKRLLGGERREDAG